MRSLSQGVAAFARWIDAVALTLVDLQRALRSKPLVRLDQVADGSLVLSAGMGPAHREVVVAKDGTVAAHLSDHAVGALRGSRIDIRLLSSLFVFRSLDLPLRAADFLGGVVRAQIDRLTPWSAAEASFGWKVSPEPAGERIQVTVAATATARIAPLIRAVESLGADWLTVSVSTDEAGQDATPIQVFERKARGAMAVFQLRRALTVVLVLALGGAASAIAADVVIGRRLDDLHDDASRGIAQRRASLQAGASVGDPEVVRLEKRKRATAPSVIVLNELAKILPDDTYVTEFRLQNNKLQIVGLTRDAPTLIRIAEQSPRFSHATFFAPTTRSAAETREHFSIEAQVEPLGPAGP